MNPSSSIDVIVSAFSADYFLDQPAVRAVYQPPHLFNAIDTRSALKVELAAKADSF